MLQLHNTIVAHENMKRRGPDFFGIVNGARGAFLFLRLGLQHADCTQWMGEQALLRYL